MNDSTIQMIAQAVIANTKVIQSLIDALPHDAKVAVAEIASPAPAPAPALHQHQHQHQHQHLHQHLRL
jgi:hypothetical protein